MNLTKYQRSILAQLKCGVLPLNIETGRFVNQPLELRTCDMCLSGAVEDEFHFLFSCEKYNAERTTFKARTPALNWNDNDDIKLSNLFTLYPRQLAKFSSQIFNIRKDALYS